MSKIMEVIVAPSGEMRLETKGFTGSSCRAASQLLEQALGIQRAERLTAEFFTQHAVEQRLQEGQPS